MDNALCNIKIKIKINYWLWYLLWKFLRTCLRSPELAYLYPTYINHVKDPIWWKYSFNSMESWMNVKYKHKGNNIFSLSVLHKSYGDYRRWAVLKLNAKLLYIRVLKIRLYHQNSNNRHFCSAVYLEIIFRGAFIITSDLA